MKFQNINKILTSLLFFASSVSGSHIVSGSNSRLPQSLSTVIKDLEAEGANSITTVAFLSSHGVTKSSRAKLLRTLFGVTGDGDHDDEVQDGLSTAFGKNMGIEEDESDVEEDGDETDGEGGDNDVEKVGIAVASPFADASVSEVTATVEACGGNIVFVTTMDDLEQKTGECLFEKLAPAVERILSEGPSDADDGALPKALLVVIEDATTQEELVQAKSKFENAAAQFLSTSIVQPSSRQAKSIQDVFDTVEFLSCAHQESSIDEILGDIGSACDPSTAADNVCKAVFKETNANVEDLANSPLDLVAAKKLLPLSRGALQNCMNTIQGATTNGDDDTTQLNLEFGSLCDATVQSTMEQFDQEVGAKLLKESTVAKRIRSDLLEELYVQLEDKYMDQIDLLYLASMESFKQSLSKLRLSPNLPSDMEKASSEAVSMFTIQSKKLRSKSSNAKSSWPKVNPTISKLKQELKEYNTLRIQTARADGKFKPLPRKGVTLGFHWLLPKPFGNDYRMEPWNVHTKDDMVYIPKDKITDVRADDVLTGDWRDSIVPSPTASEMMYFK